MNIKSLDFNYLRDKDIVNILNNSNTNHTQRLVLKRISSLFTSNDQFINFFVVNAHIIDWSIISRSKSSKIIKQVHNIINSCIPNKISKIVCIASIILNMKCRETHLRQVCYMCT